MATKREKTALKSLTGLAGGLTGAGSDESGAGAVGALRSRGRRFGEGDKACAAGSGRSAARGLATDADEGEAAVGCRPSRCARGTNVAGAGISSSPSSCSLFTTLVGVDRGLPRPEGTALPGSLRFTLRRGGEGVLSSASASFPPLIASSPCVSSTDSATVAVRFRGEVRRERGSGRGDEDTAARAGLGSSASSRARRELLRRVPVRSAAMRSSHWASSAVAAAVVVVVVERRRGGAEVAPLPALARFVGCGRFCVLGFGFESASESESARRRSRADVGFFDAGFECDADAAEEAPYVRTRAGLRLKGDAMPVLFSPLASASPAGLCTVAILGSKVGLEAIELQFTRKERSLPSCDTGDVASTQMASRSLVDRSTWHLARTLDGLAVACE